MKKALAILLFLGLGLTAVMAQTKSTKKGRISYKLSVGFISRGAGIDNNMYNKIADLAKNHPKVPGYNVIEKGKEGEKTMYFGLSELTEDEQYAFVDEVRAAVGKSKMVIVNSKLKKRKKPANLTSTAIPVGTNTTTTQNNNMTNSNPTLEGTNAATGNKYRLMVSFISKGSGVDDAGFEKIDAFVKAHPKKPIYNLEIKGREGEKKMLFNLDGFTNDEENAFVNDLTKLAEGKDLIVIESALKKAPAANTIESSMPVKCRLIISFISKGAGIDGNAHDKIISFINNHSKKPAFETFTWGREGERDYILTLKELTPDEQKLFVDEVKKLKIKSDMVFIKENEDYTKKGK